MKCRELFSIYSLPLGPIGLAGLRRKFRKN
jgi:hypothetical protein